MPAALVPLSFAQQRLWFLDQIAPGSVVYNVPLVLELDGPLDVGALERALAEIVGRHDTLRTTFPSDGGEPFQRVEPKGPWSLPVEDLSDFPADDRERQAELRVEAQILRPFDLACGPLFRASLLRLGRERHLLAAVVHHIVYDAWSRGVMLRELCALYGAFVAGQPSPLPPLSLQYADFAAQQRDWLFGDVLATQLRYWKDHLRAPLPTLSLPADRPRPAAPSFHGHQHETPLPEALMKGVRDLSIRSKVTEFVTVLSAYATLLHRLTGQDDVLIGTTVSNRRRPELESLIGFFVNTLPLRLDLSGRPTFSELVERAKHVAYGGYAHQDLPFERIVEELNPDRSPGRLPMLQVLLTFDNTPYAVHGGLSVGALTIRRRPMPTFTAKFDLALQVAPGRSGRRAAVETSDDLFDPQTGSRLVQQFKRLLEGIVEHPETPIARLPLLPDEERRMVACDWSKAASAHQSGQTLVSLFEDQVERTPDAEALVCGSTSLRYAELNSRANRVARRLRAMGVGPDDRVAISLDRSPSLIVGLLGILKAGGAYVPLDPSYPAQRLAYIATDADARVLITQPGGASTVPTGDWRVLDLDELEAQPVEADPASRANPPRVVSGGNLAYVIYTSGSTGRPKGVAVEHRSVVNLIEWAFETFAAEERAVMLASTSVNFDLSVFEVFATLSAGALLVLVDNLLTLSKAPAASRITFINTVPSVITEFLRLDDIPPGVRVVTLGGEPVCTTLVDRLYSNPSIERVFDLYGPTEATVYSTFALRAPGGRATIGRPIANTSALVLDDDQQAVPIGVKGELYLGGAGLAREYLGLPALTAERFPGHPFGAAGERLYRTGDLARWLPDGTIEFLGRRDGQIKLRGFRIELGEIEAALAAHPGIQEVLVVKRDDGAQGPRLVAYVVADEPPSDSELIHHLEQRVPSHMIPSAFVRLPALPRLPNGKLDRSILPDPPSATAPGPGRRMPRTQTEEAIAGIWCEVLGISEVGVDEDFFQMGGHSLLATRVVSRIRSRFRIPFELGAFFDSPTISSLAALVGPTPAAGQFPSGIRHVSRDQALPLSFAQQRLWFLHQWHGGNGLYHIPVAFTAVGDLNVDALEQSIHALVERHEALRTVFPTTGGTPTQRVLPEATLNLRVVDLSDRSVQERATAAEKLAAEEARSGFDLERGPLVRALLVRLAPTEHLFLLTLHHIIADAGSRKVLCGELETLYRNALAGTPPDLPSLSTQYADFSVWQRETFTDEFLERDLAYWQDQLRPPLSVLRLPLDRPRPLTTGSAGDRVDLPLPAGAARTLEAFCRQKRVTPFITLLAAFQALLHLYSGQDDVLIGTPVANRHRRDLEDLVGCFVNTLVMRGDLSGNPTFLELLQRVRRTAIDAQDHQDVPFERLVDALHVPRNTSQTPLFQVMFIVNDAYAPPRLQGLRTRPVRLRTEYSKFDLTLAMQVGRDQMRGSIEFSSELFNRSTIETMAADFVRLLDHAICSPDRPISSLPATGVKAPVDSTSEPTPGPAENALRRSSLGGDPDAAMVIEIRLADLWRELLRVSQVGTSDNFFELGGNSLLAVRLFASIESEYGVKLPLSSLFHEGTIAAQARLVAAGAPTGPWSPLVAIQPAGTRPPFFLVHGIGAEVLSFAKLAEHVGTEQPIFGLRPSLQDPAFFSTVAAVASTYVDAIRAVDPQGPYRIGGYSSGGAIAYEMAQQLQATGAQVTLLAMLDAFAPKASTVALSPPVLWRMLKNAASWPIDDEFLRSSRVEKAERLRSKIRTWGDSVDIRDRLGVWRFPESLLDTLEAHHRMLVAYRPKPYAGAVTVLRARTLRLSFRGTRDLGWRRLAQAGLRVHVVPGTHDNILTEPRVRRLAAVLVDCLTESQK